MFLVRYAESSVSIFLGMLDFLYHCPISDVESIYWKYVKDVENSCVSDLGYCCFRVLTIRTA